MDKPDILAEVEMERRAGSGFFGNQKSRRRNVCMDIWEWYQQQTVGERWEVGAPFEQQYSIC